jgi:hypothetical protein
MIRIIQIALLLAVMIPFAWMVKSGVRGLSDYWLDIGVAAVAGFLVCFALWRWDERIRQRSGRSRSD